MPRLCFPTNVLGQPIGPSFKGQEIQKREQSLSEADTNFWDLIPHLIS
jgi:hypothetical protein